MRQAHRRRDYPNLHCRHPVQDNNKQKIHIGKTMELLEQILRKKVVPGVLGCPNTETRHEQAARMKLHQSKAADLLSLQDPFWLASRSPGMIFQCSRITRSALRLTRLCFRAMVMWRFRLLLLRYCDSTWLMTRVTVTKEWFAQITSRSHHLRSMTVEELNQMTLTSWAASRGPWTAFGLI